MKRFYFIAVALTALAVGCTKSNLVDLPEALETPIAFEPYAGKTPTTKASVMTGAILESYNDEETPAFHVTAFIPGEYGKPYMDKDVWCLTSSSTEGDETTPATWKYSGMAYWPESNLEFVAYGLNADKELPAGSQTSTIEFTNGSLTEFTYAVSDLVSDQEDLIVADYQQRASQEGAAVNLQFQHLLSKVGFSLQTNKENDVVVTIKKVELKGNFFKTGTVDMLKKGDDLKVATTGTATSTSYSLFGELGTDNSIKSYNPDATESAEYLCFQGTSVGPDTSTPIFASHRLTTTVVEGVKTENITDFAGADANNRYMMLIPCTPGTTGSKATIDVIYQLTDAEEQKAKVELPESFVFEKGKGYEFVLKVSTMAVSFQVEVIDWATGTVDASYTLTPVVE